MTETEAIYNFFNSFGMPAYPANAVPDDLVFPWITYENNIDIPFSNAISITVNLWYRTESEAIPNKKVREIFERIGRGGTQIPYTDGAIWITCGSPFSIALNDENDSSIKRRALNINLEFH